MTSPSPPTVLCVDDHDDARASLTMILAHAGYRTLQARTGAEALRLAREADLVILDVRLPDRSGLEVCRRIKAAPETALVPVVLLSGYYTGGEDKAHGLEGGADAYLVKPADPLELIGQVKALLRVRQTELLLQEQARILDHVRDAVIATDLEGRITRWNGGAERLFGYSAVEALGRHVGMLYPDTERGETLPRIMAAVREHGSHEVEKRVRRKGGEEFLTHSSLSLLRDRHGEPAGVVGYSIDITERKQLEERLLQAQKMEAVGRLAGGVAHDFNNLLTIINGYGEVALRSLPEGHPAREMVRQIVHAGDRAAAMTRQLLAFSRKQMVRPRVLDLGAVIADVEKLLRPLLGEDVHTSVSAEAGLWPVKADPAQLQQVLMNLAINARDAMPSGGKLTVEARNVRLDEAYAAMKPGVRPGPYVLVAVSDTGCGMDAETLARIWEPFFTTKGERGTGLGLPTALAIVQQAGGHVTAYSEPGHGTTFKVYLPRSTEAWPAGKSFQGVRPMPRGGETVLLVEDEAPVRALVREVLAGCGYAVLEAPDGPEAVAAAKGHPGRIDLLLTDVVLPHMGGRQVAEGVLEAHPGARVLYVSGYTDDAVMRHGILGRDVDFLQKPFTTAALAQKVREVLDAEAGPAPWPGVS